MQRRIEVPKNIIPSFVNELSCKHLEWNFFATSLSMCCFIFRILLPKRQKSLFLFSISLLLNRTNYVLRVIIDKLKQGKTIHTICVKNFFLCTIFFITFNSIEGIKKKKNKKKLNWNIRSTGCCIIVIVKVYLTKQQQKNVARKFLGYLLRSFFGFYSQ